MRTTMNRLLLLLLAILGLSTELQAASELPLLTEDPSDPILYRIKNTRRTSKGSANYWTATSLTTSQANATQVYFTGTKTNGILCVKIHQKDSENTLAADFSWGEGTDWYIKQFVSAQGGKDATTGQTYKGVIISNASTFPNVYNDVPAEDGLGCWYVGSSNTAAWLYGGQWDGSIFTMEIVDPSRLPEEEPSNNLIKNGSFETGDLTGWVYGAIGGDHFVKPVGDEIFATSGGDGDYLFNTWYSSDSYVADTQNQCVYQTIQNLPAGEYVLTAKASSSSKVAITLFANNYTLDFVPGHKTSFTDYELSSIFVTPDVRSLTVGMRSIGWFRADDFQLVSLGETDAYKAYAESCLAAASIAKPMQIDAFDGQTTNAFKYVEIGAHTHGGYPLATGGVQNDRTMTDRSLMQVWTGTSYSLGNSTTSTSYTDLPNGYYRISSEVRVYDQNGGFDGTAKGFSLYANGDALPIETGKKIEKGDLAGSGFWGQYSVITNVTDGHLEAGFRLNNCSFNWYGWQNFRVEYIGTRNPGDDVTNLTLEHGQYAALCLPYELRPEYFGQTYLIGSIVNNEATLIPVDVVPTGVPCVVLASGEKNVNLGELEFDFNAASPQLSMWDNVLLQGNYDTYSWTASLVDGKTVDAEALSYKVADLSQLQFTASIENRAAATFWAQNPNYSTSSATVVEKFLSAPTRNRTDQPNPIIIPLVKNSVAQELTYSRDADFQDAQTMTLAAGATTAELYNLMPGLTYYYKTSDGKSVGQFTVGGTLRMIYVGDHVFNMRDLGGKKTNDGRYVKYGRIFRSGEMNGGFVATSDELKVMRDMGVSAEIDLRNEDSGSGVSAFGFTEEEGTFYAVRGKNYIADGPSCIDKDDAHLHWKNEFEMIVANLREQRGVDFHCRIGADRTGMVAFLLEGLLGVSEADLLRDYETTSFSTAAGVRVKTTGGFDNLLNTTFKNNIPAGGTLRDSFDKFFINTLKVKKALIEEFRSLMLSDDPAADAQLIEELSCLEVLRGAIREANQYQMGTGLSQYTCKDEAAAMQFESTMTEAQGYIDSHEYTKARTTELAAKVNQSVTALAPKLTLNMPKSGQFMMMRSVPYGGYVSCDGSYFPMVAEMADDCLFYYDGSYLMNVSTGLTFNKRPVEYGQGVDSRITAVMKSVGGKLTVKASCSKTIGAYSLHTTDADGASVMLLPKSTGNSVDGFYTWFASPDEDIYMIEAAEIPLVVPACGYTTFYLPVAALVPEGLEIYTCSLEDEQMVCQPLEGSLIPAQTPVVVRGKEGRYVFTLSTEKGQTVTSSLKGSYYAFAGSIKYYCFEDGAQGLGFYRLTSGKRVPAFAAYYNGTASGSFIPLINQTDGIQMPAVPYMEKAVYDLQGRRVEKPGRGLYIVDGKKKMY